MKSSLVKISGGILLVMGLVSGCGNQGSQNVTQPNPYYNPSVAAVPTTTTGCPVPGYGYPGTTGYPAGYPAGYPYNTGYAGTTVAGCPSVAGYPAGYGYPTGYPVAGYGYPVAGYYPPPTLPAYGPIPAGGYGYPGYGGGAYIGFSWAH
jgi:hypothetical protein